MRVRWRYLVVSLFPDPHCPLPISANSTTRLRLANDTAVFIGRPLAPSLSSWSGLLLVDLVPRLRWPFSRLGRRLELGMVVGAFGGEAPSPTEPAQSRGRLGGTGAPDPQPGSTPSAPVETRDAASFTSGPVGSGGFAAPMVWPACRIRSTGPLGAWQPVRYRLIPATAPPTSPRTKPTMKSWSWSAKLTGPPGCAAKRSGKREVTVAILQGCR